MMIRSEIHLYQMLSVPLADAALLRRPLHRQACLR